MRRVIFLFLCAILISGCTRQEPMVVASKTFSENKLLAEMFALLATEKGIPVKRIIPFGNTFDLQEAIKEGRIDLYPEYTGTGLSMMGLPAMSDGEQAIQVLRQQFGRFQIAWLERLGFNNSYVLSMQPDVAARMQATTISDLVDQEETLRMGCEEEFLARPVDGFQPLMRHYGFSREPEVVVAQSREQLYRHLVAGQTDVCVVQRTDPQIREFGLSLLEDNLDFFPVYQGVPLVRKETLRRFPDLRQTLDQLSGKLSNRVMRELNREVELDGQELRSVAVRFLVQHGLLTKKPPELKHRRLVVAVPPSDHRSRILAKSLDAVRRVFPKRRVEVETFSFPKEALLNNKAFIALLGAEDFFAVRPGLLPHTRQHMEAVAVAGFRMIHLVRRTDTIQERPFAGIRRLGVGPAGGSAEQAAAILLDAYAKTDAVEVLSGPVSAQVKEVIKGELDALMFIAAPGDANMVLLLGKPELSLQPIVEWKEKDRQYRYPFFRLARIPEDIYPGIAEPLKTIGTQVVLAGPRPETQALGDGDPITGLRLQRQPIPTGVKQALAKALGDKETIDPTLPGERVSVVTARREVVSVNPAPAVSAITSLFLLALGGFFYMLLRNEKPSGTKP